MPHNARTISNSFSVNTLVDGKDGAVAFAFPDKISIPCFNNWKPKSQVVQNVTLSLKAAGNNVTVSSVTIVSKPSDVSVASPASNARVLTIPTTADLSTSSYASGIVFTVTGTYNGETYSANVTVALIGSPQGTAGEQGKTGRAYYYGGEFDQTNSTDTFIVNDAQCPYFSHGVNANSGLPNCHVLDKAANGTYTMVQMYNMSTKESGQINWNVTPWTSVYNDQKFLMSAAIFTDFAKLGSAIFNADFMYSKYGVKNGAESTAYQDFGLGNETFVQNGDHVRVATSTSVSVNAQYIMVLKKSVQTVITFRANVEKASGQSTAPTMDIKIYMDGWQDATTETELNQYYITGTTITSTSIPSSNSTITLSTSQLTYSGKYFILFKLNNSSLGNGYVDYMQYQQSNVFLPNMYFDLLLGEANFGGKSTHFGKDGSGWLASKKIYWDADGNAYYLGFIKAAAVYVSIQTPSANEVINPNMGNMIQLGRGSSPVTVYLPSISDHSWDGLHLTISSPYINTTSPQSDTMVYAVRQSTSDGENAIIYASRETASGTSQTISKGFKLPFNRVIQLYVINDGSSSKWVLDSPYTDITFIRS